MLDKSTCERSLTSAKGTQHFDEKKTWILGLIYLYVFRAKKTKQNCICWSKAHAKGHSLLPKHTAFWREKKTWILLEVRFKYPTTVSIFIVRESKITEYTLQYDYLRNLLKRYLNFHCEKIIELHIDNTRNGNKNFWENSRQFFLQSSHEVFSIGIEIITISSINKHNVIYPFH